MKKTIILMAQMLTCAIPLFAQNTFPSTGNAGIGITVPLAPLHTLNNNRSYVVNKALAGETSTLDNTGLNYVLLHPAYDGTLLGDCQTFGIISGVRGHTGNLNRKWTVQVNTGSAYNANTGSIVCYNEAANLVTLRHQGTKYMAVEISKNSRMYNFSFTGYMANASLTLVNEADVSEVTVYNGNLVNIPGGLNAGNLLIPGTATIGTNNLAPGTAKLSVEGTIAARKVKVQQTGWPDFVFADDYQLPSLDSVETFVRSKKHLPGIPSEAEVKRDGLDLGDINTKLLQKVEELTLYLIEIKKENAEMKKRLEKLEK